MRTFSLRAPVSLAFALIATHALAHAQLEKASPPVGGTVASATEIRLTFGEGVEPRFSGATLAAAGGANVPLGQPKVEGSDKRVLILPIANVLAAGLYTVHWRAVSVDTHHTQGAFQFTVKP
jgi:methionine-rich copper-binding protein CopC